eukprot:20404-Heterococcus_DN1.PRE.2
MARTTVNISCACRLFFALAVTVLVCPGAVAFTPASGLHSQTVALQQQQQQMTTALRPSAAADVTTLKRDIAQNLRVLTAQRCRPCEEYDATAAAESSVALKEITAKLYNAPARTAWTTATTSAVAAGVAQRAVSSSTTMQSLPGTKKSSSSGGGAAVLERPPKLEFVPVAEKDDPKFCDKYKLFSSYNMSHPECGLRQRGCKQCFMQALLNFVVLALRVGLALQVMLFNDSGNTRDYVARSLVQ